MAIFSKYLNRKKSQLFEWSFVTAVDYKQSFIRRLSAVALAFFLDDNKKDVGSLWQRPKFINWLSASLGLYGNTNNLGNPFSTTPQNYQFIQQLEREIVAINSKLIRSQSPLEGYVTNGGTEANLFLMWAGREQLRKAGVKKVCLLFSEFAHYSLTKSARLLDLNVQLVRVDGSWRLDANNLKQAVSEEYKKGRHGFLLPITVGYSSTGLSDSIDLILKTIDDLNHSLPKARFFIWVDAAAQGLVKSLLDQNYRPLADTRIKGYVIDFHKFGGVPVPAGLVLYRPQLRTLIEKKIDYLHEVDATVSGSRPGFSVLSIWSALNYMESTKEKFRYLENKKRHFVKKFAILFPKATLIYEKNSLTMAILIDRHFSKLSQATEQKYGLVECEIGNRRHYKLHFLK